MTLELATREVDRVERTGPKKHSFARSSEWKSDSGWMDTTPKFNQDEIREIKALATILPPKLTD